MSTPLSVRPCVVAVLVPAQDRHRPDPTGLVEACVHRLERLDVIAWTDADDLDVDTVERAAATVDLLRAHSAARLRYAEATRDLTSAFSRPGADHWLVIALASGARRRLVGAVRHAAARHDAHVALVPAVGAATPQVVRA